MTTPNKLSLDVSSPDKVATILRAAADQYRDDHNNLISAWQQGSTPWAAIARILDRAADSIDKLP